MSGRILIIVSLLALSCARPGITIYTSPEMARGTVYIDGVARGNLSASVKHYRWVGWRKMMSEFSLPPRDESFVTIHDLSPGVLSILVTKPGQPALFTKATFDGRKSIELDLSRRDGSAPSVN